MSLATQGHYRRICWWVAAGSIPTFAPFLNEALCFTLWVAPGALTSIMLLTLLDLPFPALLFPPATNTPLTLQALSATHRVARFAAFDQVHGGRVPAHAGRDGSVPCM